MSGADLQQRIDELTAEVGKKNEELHELIGQLPDEPVDDFVLQNLAGPVRLSELFGRHEDLIVIHNMGKGCPYCTLWADGLSGMVPYFESRAGLALCSPDAPEVQQSFAEERGWRFQLVSNDSGFSEAMGYTKEEGGRTVQWPGYSTFHRDGNGSIRRVAHSYFGPGDTYCGIWHMFGLLEGGVGDWQPAFHK